MTADEQDYCPCGCRVIWSTKHQMTLCLGCDLRKEPHADLEKEPSAASKK